MHLCLNTETVGLATDVYADWSISEASSGLGKTGIFTHNAVSGCMHHTWFDELPAEENTSKHGLKSCAFRCGLDVFEHEPAMCPGLAEQPNAVIVPHIASASMWTRSGMVSQQTM